ncbi:hypothetical protein NQ176_g1279 [Zarea fungicola]|uniref:Uncharacterized protein n=1 Tax=Zarea fungicola TaxID=93591 RepID=A0ACC1NUZ8_9HYPO|nr:hypothetical protein NQ176_g1279 [Lecanicillium fungicola]
MDRRAFSKGKHKRRPKRKDRETREPSGRSGKTRVTESRRSDDDPEARKRGLAGLMVSYHIKFGDDYDTGRFPISLLNAIKVVGAQVYLDEEHTGRWRQNLLLRAKKLVQVAMRRELYGLEFTEITWIILENDIFEHLRYDPTCKRCKYRWWRSDIPVKEPGNGDTGTEETECMCSGTQVGVEFSQRVSDSIMPANFYDDSLTKLLGGDGFRRSRMFGLLSSGFLAADVIALGSRVGQTNEGISSVLPQQDSQQHSMLPFLVCVAELTGEEVNTELLRYKVAFAMHHALASQQRVAVGAAASGETFEPLAWCLAYKNTDSSECALFAARLRKGSKEERDNLERPPIRIVQIWGGELTSMDSALQLLRLVDYIAEWANTVYHDNIARCFQYLVQQIDSEDSNDSDTSCTRLS